jgi:DinB family protein
MTVSDVATQLRALAASVSRELQAATPEAAARRPGARTWSPKEVLGHLIDSAGNNHQRFVRAQETDALTMPGYEQNHWVSSQGYQDADWSHLVALWAHLNLHLADVIARIPPSKYSVSCTIGSDPPAPLESIVTGYLDHLNHHIAQIRQRLG